MKTFKNSFLRSLKSGRRLIGLIFFFGYYGWISRSFWSGGSGSGKSNPFSELVPPNVPTDLLHSIAFGAFGVFSFLSFASIGSQLTLMFRSPDVDVLFPTPVPAKHLLIFKLIRDSLLTAVVPVILIFVFGSRSGATLMQNWQSGSTNPGAIYGAHRLSFLAWVLQSFFWTSIGYAVSLYLSRGTVQSDRWAKIWNRFTLVIGLLLLGYIVAKVYVQGPGSLAKAFRDPVLATILFPGYCSSQFVLAPITGAWNLAIPCLAFLIVGAGVALKVAFNNADWLYEVTAMNVQVMDQRRQAAKNQDMVSIAAQRAQSGKFKIRQGWIQRLEFKGKMALVWKELIIFSRSTQSMFVVFTVLFVGVGYLSTVIPAVSRSGRSTPVEIFQPMMFGFLAFVVCSAVATTGFIQMLKLGDVQKPLPFTPGQIVFFEVFAKTIPILASIVLGSLVSIAFRPSMWSSGLASILGAGSFAFLVCSLYCVLFLLFPEYEDPTQRGFRGIVMLLGITVFSLPSVFVVFLMYGVLKLPILAAVAPAALVNLGLAMIAASIGGKLYGSFNASD
ncbi:MAG: hypothetical protein K8R88_12445 [Armatimonadetes bacterium]|nr:hypothetical protein [Armatimonadota bacterium]